MLKRWISSLDQVFRGSAKKGCYAFCYKGSIPWLASEVRQLETFFFSIPLGLSSEITAKREGIM